jgi:hypothetical protein
MGVAVDSSGNVYIADNVNNRVVEFSGGVFSGWAGACTSGTNCVGGTHSNGFTCTAATCTGVGTSGSGDGQFHDPADVSVDSSGNVYVADLNNNRVVLFLSPVSDLAGFTSSTSGQILIVLGDFAIYPHGTKPPGVGFQSGRDTTPVGFVSGMLSNPETTVFDTNTAYVASSGRPIGSFMDIFVVGGPLANAVSYYYQHTSVAGDKAPVSFGVMGSNYIWTDKNGTVALTVPQSSEAVPPGSSDVFAIEVFTDTGGRTVVLMYGTTFVGTWAAAYYFKYILYPNVGTYANGYYLIRWTDATSGPSANGVPDLGDTWTILATSTS